ncbi:PEP-CTERM protein-sorting domain-containing protein [Nitrosospira multiformis]|uniref:PEP-CTERM protein-sorting domain-containing protein n=1 Tax=Nitrosospira multiformis TaxID=1231 RepID=A0A1H8BJV6_9PROT|nr:PEP-CTERM sorting domain-containing protein [Nitrosospira multiformis]SEM83073.1 PEP-CTERM protein-sorting domain-containing protein [Nitrosospira multiformis]
MNKFSQVVIAALAFGGSISAASAAGVITNITASGAGLGSFDFNIDDDDRTIDLSKTFDSVNPIVLTFTVGHDTGPGNPYTVSEAVTNSTGQDWIDFHYAIGEPDQGQGVVFTAHNSSTLSGFTLDQSSGPRNLDFTGSLASGALAADAAFTISPFDPGQGNTTTFTLTQVPTIPEPETYAMLLAGLGLMGVMAKRRSSKNA